MDSVPAALFLCGLLSSAWFVDMLILVRAPSPVVATAGKEALSLECSYRVTGSDTVIAVNWYHRYAGEKNFRIIAQIPNPLLNLPPTFNDERLASKGKVTVRKMGIFTLVNLKIDPAECIDRGTYECEVRVYGGQASHKAKVQVHLNEEPAVPLLAQEPSIPVENHPITFTCTGSMGRPVGTFRWLVYKSRHRSPLEEVEMSGITSFNKVPGRCSPIGTSTLAIMVTSDDRKVTCVIEQRDGDDVHQVSNEKELDVRYRVTDTQLYAKVGDMDLPISREIVVHKGDKVNLLCKAHGNPRPKFNWSYLPFNGQTGLVHISTFSETTIKNIKTNQSGSYVCVTTNYIDSTEYSETSSVRVIVKEKIGRDVQLSVKNENPDVGRYLLIGGVVLGALMFIVLVSLLTVRCVRRCSPKPLDQQVRYSASLVETHILVRTTSPIVATIGKNPLLLECSFQVTEGDVVLDVNWYHQTAAHDDFHVIAQIPNPDILNFPPTFEDKRWASNGKVVVRKMGLFTTIQLEIDPVACVDGGVYECEVRVYGGKPSHKAKVQVHINEEPTIPLLTHSPPVMVEQHPVTFTCTATMGRPAWTFRWLLYKNQTGRRLTEVEMTGTTVLSKMTGTCSPTGTSRLAVMVTSADVKVKCMVQQKNDDGVVRFADEKELDVKYGVREPELFIRVDKEDLSNSRDVFAHGGEDVYFMCMAYGNPQPHFRWSYLPFGGQSGLVTLSASPNLTLQNVGRNNSGSYVCTVNNHISSREYTATRAVRLIVNERNNRKNKHWIEETNYDAVGHYSLIGGVIVGTILFTTFISLLAVTCIRRHSAKAHGQQIHYSGVRA